MFMKVTQVIQSEQCVCMIFAELSIIINNALFCWADEYSGQSEVFRLVTAQNEFLL